MTVPPAPVPPAPVPPAPVAHGRRVFRNTMFTGAVGIFSLAANFFVIGQAAGRLKEGPFGVLTLALAFSFSAGYLTVADLGLQSGVTRFIADADGRGQRERIGEVVSSALAVLSVTAIVAVAILLTLSFVGTHIFNVGDAALQNDLRVLFMLFAAEALFGLPGLAFLGVLQGLQRFGWVKLVDLSRQILYTILALTVLLTGRGVIWFGAAMISGRYSQRSATQSRRSSLCPEMRISPRLIHRDALRPLARFSGWVFISRINGVIWSQMDVIILQVAIGVNVLAGYSFAARLQSAVSYPLSLTAAAIVPAAAKSACSEIKWTPARTADPRHALHPRAFATGDDRSACSGASAADRLGHREVRGLCRSGTTLSHVSIGHVHRHNRNDHVGRHGPRACCDGICDDCGLPQSDHLDRTG